MALFQEKQTENFEEFNEQSPISRDYSDEFKTIYNERMEYAENAKQEESLYLQNLISQDKINEWKSKGGMTAIEVWNKKNKHELLPYAGTISQGKQTFKIKSISDKLRNGQRISAEERQQFDEFLLDMAEVQARGYTFGGSVTNIGLETLPFVAEFGVGLLTSGGVGSLGSATAKGGIKATLKGMQSNVAKTLAEKTGSQIAGDIAKGAGKVVYNATLNPRTTAFTATRLPQQVYARIGDVMLSDSLAITEEGQVILKEAETNPAIAFMKALALTNIEVASEASGDILVRPFLHGMERVVGLKALKQLTKIKLPENFAKLAEDVTNMPFARAVDQLGFNGILEEIGEERVADLLKFSFNLDEQEGYSFEQFLDSAFPTPAELAQEAVAFGVIGAGANVAHKGLQKVSENYTKDGFLVDAGIFRVAGQDSSLDAKVKESLQQQGVSEEEIENVLQFATRDDKTEFLKHGTINQNEINERAEKVATIKNKYYTQNLNAGVEDVEALENAEFTAQAISSFANQFNLSIEEAEEKFGFKVQSMTDKEAEEQQKKDNLKPEQIHYQLIGEKGANNLGDKLLYRAKNLEANGATPEEIYKKSGWYRGADNKWRMEISDGKAIEDPKIERVVDEETGEIFFRGTLEDIYDNPALYKAYPHLADLKISIQNMPSSTHGYYNGEYLVLSKLFFERQVENKTKQRRIKELEKTTEYKKYDKVVKLFAKDNEKYGDDLLKAEEEFLNTEIGKEYDNLVWNTEDTITAYGLSEQGKSTLVHEIQHAIQDFEQFAKGGNLKTRQKFVDELNRLYINALLNQAHKAKEELIKIYGWDKADEIIDVMFKYYEPAPYSNLSQDEKNKLYSEFWENQSDETFETTERIWKENKDTEALNKINTLEKEYGVNLSEYDFYKNLYGEVEARNVQTRVNLTEEQRKQSMPEDTQDVTNDKAILVFKNNTSFLSENNIKITPIHIENNAVPEKERVADVKDWIIENLNLLGDITVQSNGRVIKFSKGNINRSMKDIGRNKARRNSYAKLKELVETSIQDDIDIRPADEKHKNVLHQELYYNAINYNGRTYGVEISVDIPKSEKTPNTYAGHKVKVIEMEPSAIGVHQKGTTNGTDSTISINDIKRVFNPNITDYYQFNIEEEQDKRGFAYERTNFDGTQKDNIMVLLKGKHDKSTYLHEFAHIYLTALNNLARTNDKAKDMLIKVNKFLRYNGKEYTTAQHEKFANYFVAYVRTGKAPTYGLKKVFENFRKWLNDLYTNLQLTGEVELSKEAVDLFDELLGNMTLKAQKEISEEIVKKAKHNALLKHQEAEAEKHNIPTNQLTERQRRYRDTAYDILWYAISHSKSGKEFVKDKKQLYMLLGNDHKANKKNKGITRQSERLFELLSELDDEFSANDGFLPEWDEFFYNPNVEEGNDAELALQALDVIQNKKYLYDYEEKYQELSNEDVKIAELELDYLLEEYSNETGDKSNIVCAFFDWIEEKHPYIQEDLINRWELRTNEIDRYQSLSKFQQAKEDLKIIASKMQGHGDYSMQFAEYARAILKRLDFMTERDKEKIFDKLKKYNSFREIERNLDYVMDYAETLQDVTDRRKIADDIVKEVKQTIHEWKDGIKRTKYTYPANKLFERLRQIERMKLEEVENLYDELVNEKTSPSYVADEVNNETFYETIERMFVTFKHNGNCYNSTEFLTDLLNKIQSAKFTAKVARDEKDFELQMQKINLIDECAKAVEEHKKDNKGKLVEVAQKANAHVMNLNGALKMIFNDSIKNKFSLDYLYAKKDGLVGHDRREVLDKLKDAFQFKNDAQLYLKFIDMTKPEYEIRQRFTPDIESGSIHTTDIFDKESGQTKASVKQILPEGMQRSEWEAEPVKLSKMEILYYYIQAKNKISYQMLTDMGDETRPPKGQFDKFEFDQMIGSLTPQEQLMGDILQVSAEKYYDGLNAYHIKKYHTDLGKVSCYFPRLSETEDPKMLDVFNDYVSYNAKDSSQKHRTAYIGTRIKPANAVAVLFQHIEKANTIIVMGEQLDLMNKVFNNSNLKKKIENHFGQDITQAFYQHVTANLYSGQKAIRSLQEEFFAKLANNVIKTQIFAKPQVGLKQVLSFMNYGKGDEYVSAGEWLKEFTKQTLTPTQWKKNVEFMLENDFLKDRFTRGGSTDALKRQLENRIFSKLSLLDEFWGLPIRLGDMGAIIWGGKPYIDVLLKKGYTKEQAFKIFIETTVNDQQSSIPSTLSNAQRNVKNSAWGTMMFAYQNTPYQYLRSAYTPIVTALQKGGKENIKKAGKMFFIYGWLFPAIFNIASSLSIFAVGGDEDQLKKDMLYAFLGLFGMLPITGDFISAIIYGLAGDYQSGGSDYFSSATRKLNKLALDIKKDKVTPKDIWDSTVIFGEIFGGQPVGAVGNAVSGAYNVTQGEVAKGSLKLLGFSDYRAKYVTGEKKDKK